jgi:ATP-dependent exoDNAse (exonuclease V) alpha subunit
VAIDYINVSIVSAGRGQTAVGLAAYIGRYDTDNPLTKRKHRFAQNAGDLVFPPEILLPADAPEEFRDPKSLWIAAERAEVVQDRKNKEVRFRVNAAFAKHVILAVPKELSNAENWELGLEWARQKYPGVAVMAAMHHPDDPEIGNCHIHLLVSTRVVDKDGFGKRARHLDPRFAGKADTRWHHLESQDLPGQWRAFQNEFFRRRGIPLAVDPSRALGGVHWGNARYITANDREADDRAAAAAARLRMLDPAEVVTVATRNRATFNRRSIAGLLARHDIKGEEARGILDRIFDDTNTLQLFDPETGEPLQLFTTRAVRDQEARILERAADLAKRPMPPARWQRVKAAATNFELTEKLSEEQFAALQHVVENRRLSMVRGLAGAGKSFTMQAMRGAYEKAGYRVIGSAPTNTVVASMAVDGFSYAATLHSEKYRQENPRGRRKIWDGQAWVPSSEADTADSSDKPGHTLWNSKTCIIVDEAGMADSEMMEWLLTNAADVGAKVILVGDEAQLASVSRGGMFGILKRTFGAAELREVRRQEADWAKAASIDLAEGRIPEALAAYDAHRRIHWSNEIDDAVEALVTRFRADLETDRKSARFVYCATNKVANHLNDRLQHVRFGERSDFEVFDCDRGRIKLFPSDRVQFHATDKRLGIMNGHVGTVVSMKPDEIVVDIENGGQISFDPQSFTGWGLGYSGTVYRGQGKTLPRAYALYDNAYSWSARATYVALTRHKQAFDLFVPRALAKDIVALGKQMSRRDGADASHAYLTADEAAARFPRVMIDAMAEDGRSQSVNAVDPVAATLLETHWRLAPPARFSRDYNRIKKAASNVDAVHPLRQLLPNADETARERGFYPWNGKPDPRCLQDLILWEKDGLVRRQDPALKPPKGAIEIRPIVVDISQLEYDAWFRLSRRLRELDHTVLKAIGNRLNAVSARIKTTAELFFDLTIAKHCVRLAALLKRYDTTGKPRQARRRKDFLHVRSLNPVQRQTHGRFYLHRNHPQHGRVAIDLLGFVSRREVRRAAAQERSQKQTSVIPPSDAPVQTNGQPTAPIPPVLLDPKEADERASILGGTAPAPTKDGAAVLKPTVNGTTPRAPAADATQSPPAKGPAHTRQDDGHEL